MFNDVRDGSFLPPRLSAGFIVDAFKRLFFAVFISTFFKIPSAFYRFNVDGIRTNSCPDEDDDDGGLHVSCSDDLDFFSVTLILVFVCTFVQN